MDIDVAHRYLGQVPMDALRERILSLPLEAWQEQKMRQQVYEVHRDTESIVMLFCDESWPDGDIYREAGWDRIADVAMPLIDHIVNTYYEPGGTVLRAMAAKLKVGGRIVPHTDSLRSFEMGHRIHVPITTNPAVNFLLESKPVRFEIGSAYELNNQRRHSASNLGKEDRISFIFDYVPAGAISGA